MSQWNQITNESELKHLLSVYGGFHDGCIRDIYMSTKQYVNNDLSMSFNGVQQATILFQRQFDNPSTIELKFEELERLNFNPPDNGIIYDCTLKFIEGTFYFADEENWQLKDNSVTWISSKKLFWRERPDLIGAIKRMD